MSGGKNARHTPEPSRSASGSAVCAVCGRRITYIEAVTLEDEARKTMQAHWRHVGRGRPWR